MYNNVKQNVLLLHTIQRSNFFPLLVGVKNIMLLVEVKQYSFPEIYISPLFTSSPFRPSLSKEFSYITDFS